jgi:hypothetical protein
LYRYYDPHYIMHTDNIRSTYSIVGKLVAAHGYRQKRENKLEIKK